MCCRFAIVRLTERGGSGGVKLTHHERWWVWDEGGEAGDERGIFFGGDRLALAFVVGMRGHHIFLLRHIMTAEKRVMAVAVVMAMA